MHTPAWSCAETEARCDGRVVRIWEPELPNHWTILTEPRSPEPRTANVPHTQVFSRSTIPKDLAAGLVVFLVALPLCLGVALASGAPLLSGILAGIVGGILVGMVSGSHTSVSGPAAGLTAVVAAQILTLGSFEAFLTAVVLAGLIQIVLGVSRAGFIAAFFPSAVIKGLLAAIGVILILKQLPHVFGHDTDPEGDMSFSQPDHENTFSELFQTLSDINPSAAIIGLLSIGLLIVWSQVKVLKTSAIPAPLLVVVLGVILAQWLQTLGGNWRIGSSHLVQLPPLHNLGDLLGSLRTPDTSLLSRPAVYLAALTMAAVASLETLLNLEATDKLDPRQRNSRPNRELIAQGIGNVVSGLIGGLPVTSVIVRSSVNINAGGQSKLSAIIHGVLLLVSVTWLSRWMNMIPLSCLAAILLMTGIKLVSPELVKRMWSAGRNQFIPFAVTVVAIVFTDLLIGILIGLAVSISFILWSNTRQPIRRIMEKHLGGDVVRIELANQVSFLNRAALDQTLNDVPRGGHVMIDARATDYIDPDVLDLLMEYVELSAPARGVKVSLSGFQTRYPQLRDQTQYVDYSTREIQNSLTPGQVLEILKEGHQRFRSGQRLSRDLSRQVDATASGQHPLAVILSCIDSRAPTELIFDLGVGDIFSIRIAGNVTSPKVLGSAEYACAVVGSKLILVLGHTRCGAVGAAVKFSCTEHTASQATGCQHLDYIVQDIQASIDPTQCRSLPEMPEARRDEFVDDVARRNVLYSVEQLLNQSHTLRRLADEGRIAVVGAMYDVVSGKIEFLSENR